MAAWGSWDGDGALRKGAQELANRIAGLEIGKGCPWHDEESVWALWCVREYADADAALEHGLSAMRDAIQEGKGWPVYVDPWGFIECASNVDHPLAREIVIRELPVILRGQLPDGSWNEDDYYGTGNMITALVKHGLFEPLRKAPPLPADWRIVRSIPAPQGDLQGMTWDEERLWVYDRESGDAIALSTDSGKILARAEMPAGVCGLTWLLENLVAVKGEDRAIQYVDPEAGEASEPVPVGIPWGALSAITTFDGGLCVTHLHRGSVHFIDGPLPFNDDPETALVLGGCGAIDMTSVGDTIWCVDFLGPTIIASKPHDDGRIVDWGEKPFGSHTTGIAHDGRDLWVLDNKGKRVCIIEKVVPYEPADTVRADLAIMYSGGPGFGCPREDEWSKIFDMEPQQRVAAYEKMAADHNCTQATHGDAILWLNEERKIEAMFFFVDARDLSGHLRFLDLVHRMGSPLSYLVIAQHSQDNTTRDVLKMVPTGYIQHQNEIESAVLRPLPRDPSAREDLAFIARRGVWQDQQVVELCNSPRQKAVEELDRVSQEFHCAQKVRDGAIQWYGEGGHLEAMFFVGDDNDLDFIRSVYARAQADDCPVTWLLLRLTRMGGQVVDMICLERNHYMAVRNRCGQQQ